MNLVGKSSQQCDQIGLCLRSISDFWAILKNITSKYKLLWLMVWGKFGQYLFTHLVALAVSRTVNSFYNY